MRPLLIFAAVAMIASTASLASAEPPCATPCVVEAVPPLTPTKMRSIPVFVTGIFFDVVGGAATAAGAIGIPLTIVGGKTVPDVQKTGMTGSPLLGRF